MMGENRLFFVCKSPTVQKRKRNNLKLNCMQRRRFIVKQTGAKHALFNLFKYSSFIIKTHARIHDANPTERTAIANATCCPVHAFDFRLWLRLKSLMQLTAAI